MVATSEISEGFVDETGACWRPIPGLEDRFVVSETGLIMSFSSRSRRWRPMKPASTRGYKRITFMINQRKCNMYVHRAVALAFLPNPFDKPQVNHIDLDRANNSLRNLEWCTAAENIRHAFAHRPHMSTHPRPQGTAHYRAKLNETKVVNIMHCRWSIGGSALARLYGVTPSTVHGIWKGKLWKQLFR